MSAPPPAISAAAAMAATVSIKYLSGRTALDGIPVPPWEKQQAGVSVRAGVRSAVCSGGFRAVLRVLSDAWELEVAVCADSECGVSTIPSPPLDFRCRRRPGCADRPRHGPHSLNQPTSRSSSEPSRAEPSRRRAADPIRVQGCALAQEERHAVGRIAQAPPAGRADRVGTKPRAHLKPHRRESETND